MKNLATMMVFDTI